MSAPTRCLLALLTAAATCSAQVGSQPETHWAFRRPLRPELPAVQRSNWPRNPIDRFVLARLEGNGRAPSREAVRTTLMRRVYLDLIGLPPSPEEVAAFVGDSRADAYQRLVDRLLASEHFGEQMALHWLDLARYSDTNGYEFDSDRQAWRWRDWVIAAFNSNKRFDQFTIEQLAGDLLPRASIDQRIATAFHRHHPMTYDDAGQPGQYRDAYVADRVDTTSTVWLGLTMACARCHDHKYDAISQRDYYGLYAFFDNLDEKGLTTTGNAEPRLPLPSTEQGALVCELQAQIDAARSALRAREAELAPARDRWLENLRAEPIPPVPVKGLVAYFAMDAPRGGQARPIGLGKTDFVAGIRGRALRFDGNDSFVDGGDVHGFGADDPFSIGAWVRLEGDIDEFPEATIVAKIDEAKASRGYVLDTGFGRVSATLISNRGDRISITTRDRLPRNRWRHVLFTYDGSKTEEGLSLFVDGARAPLRKPRKSKLVPIEQPSKGGENRRQKKKALEGGIDNPGTFRIGTSDGAPFEGTIDEVRIWSRALSADEVAALVTSDVAAVAHARPAATPLLADSFRACDASLRSLRGELRELQARRVAVLADVPVVSVMAERKEPQETHLLKRGNFQTPGAVLPPGTPSALPALAEHLPHNRLGLAKWLVDRDHPLVGRVTVNRLWQQFFGRGLVATVGDFGTRGERPTHPQLLDWLAREFVDGGWDVKQLVRLFVTSATYRQDSRVTESARTLDTENRWLGRMSRLRLPAESIRDAALSIAAQLDRRVGGDSIRPWQPLGRWPLLSPKPDRNRRGLYVYRKRSAPYASFLIFDAPRGDVCTPRRSVTTTPLQSLVMLNDRTYVAAARGLARRVLTPEMSDRQRLALAFRTCVAREPSPRELAVLCRLLDDQFARLAKDAKAAREVAADHDPERDRMSFTSLATWTGIATVLLNLEETTTRR